MSRFTIAAIAFVGIGSTGCGESKPTEAAAVPAPPPPLSAPAQSREELESKVGPMVELSATPQGEPGRYDRLGSRRFNALNSLSPTAALYIAASRQCDQLVDIDTRSSSRDEFVWRGQCANGNRYTVFENDVSAVKPRLQGHLTEAAITALPPPEPDDGAEPNELGWLRPCVGEIRKTVKPDETFLHDAWKLGRRAEGKRTLRINGTVSSNAFKERPARFDCVGDVKSGRILEVIPR